MTWSRFALVNAAVAEVIFVGALVAAAPSQVSTMSLNLSLMVQVSPRICGGNFFLEGKAIPP